jgi:hypothetical protein
MSMSYTWKWCDLRKNERDPNGPGHVIHVKLLPPGRTSCKYFGPASIYKF